MDMKELKELSEKELYSVHKALEANIMGLFQELERIEGRIGNANTPEELKTVWGAQKEYWDSLVRQTQSSLASAMGMARRNVLCQILRGRKNGL